jgi:hypothetical protein
MITREPTANSKEEGVALVIVALLLLVFLLFSGLAIDLGRAYLIKAQLTKSVDGAALAGARALGTSTSSTPAQDEARRIFRANFPGGYLGTGTVTDPYSDPNFCTITYDAASGANVIAIRAQASLPVTFMRLAGFGQLTVSGNAEVRRRLVDLSLVIDCSTSIGSDWSTVRAAAQRFINSFDESKDRIAVTLFSNGATVSLQMSPSLGFNKTTAMNNTTIPSSLPGTYTSMAEGFYRAWDELRSVPPGSQSSLRVIVLFTDGTPNGVSGNFQYYPTSGPATSYISGLNTNDFPSAGGYTTDYPYLIGLFSSLNCTNCSINSSTSLNQSNNDQFTPSSPRGWNSTQTSPRVPWLPSGTNSASFHPNHRSIGIPTSFPLASSSLRINGIVQSTARDLRGITGGRYPADIHNLNNAARNLLEIIADAARREYPSSGDYPIRVYTIGMGDQVNMLLGTIPEPGSDILKRIANDKTSLDYNSAQVAGKFYYAQTATDVDPAFQALRNEIVRLSK